MYYMRSLSKRFDISGVRTEVRVIFKRSEEVTEYGYRWVTYCTVDCVLWCNPMTAFSIRHSEDADNQTVGERFAFRRALKKVPAEYRPAFRQLWKEMYKASELSVRLEKVTEERDALHCTIEHHKSEVERLGAEVGYLKKSLAQYRTSVAHYRKLHRDTLDEMEQLEEELAQAKEQSAATDFLSELSVIMEAVKPVSQVYVYAPDGVALQALEMPEVTDAPFTVCNLCEELAQRDETIADMKIDYGVLERQYYDVQESFLSLYDANKDLISKLGQSEPTKRKWVLRGSLGGVPMETESRRKSWHLGKDEPVTP